MKSLRLLLFKKCNRSCLGCCNNDWDLDGLEQVKSFADYDSVMLTGGEPMLDSFLVVETVTKIRKVNDCPIYKYTAKCDDHYDFLSTLAMLDSVTLTLHDQSDVAPFKKMNAFLSTSALKNKSLRLNVFSNVDIRGVKTDGWIVKEGMKWIKDCPLPDNEIFMKL